MTHRNDYPPHALSVLDHDADFTLSSSSYGYWLLGGVPAPTFSGNSGRVVPLELFSPGTEHDPSSSLPSSFYGYHLLDGAPTPASSGDSGVVSIDGSPSATDYDLSFLPMPSSCLLDGAPAPVSFGDGDAAVPTERFPSVTDSDLSSPLQTFSDLLDGALALITDSDCGALSTEESESRTDYNLSFPSVVCSQQYTTANELFNGHLHKDNLIIIDHDRDTTDSEQLKISLFNARSF